jgi:hypothetical protein
MNAGNTALTNDVKDEGLEDILNNIRDVIIGKAPNTDVLELTAKVTDGVTNTQVANQNEALIDVKVAQESREALKHFVKFAEKNEIDSLPIKNGTTIEDIIISLLKPQISDWLNKNLSGIVHNIVQKEIKKLIPKDE